MSEGACYATEATEDAALLGTRPVLCSKVPLRAWKFTINNYTKEDEEAVLALAGQEGVLRLVCGREVAPTTGTAHLQGYVRFRKSVRGGQARLALGGRAMCFPKRGKEPEVEASSYCKKDGNVLVDFGVDYDAAKGTSEESRSAAKRVIGQIDHGATPRELWEANRVFFMFNAKRVRDEWSRHKFYMENPKETGWAPVDRPL